MSNRRNGILVYALLLLAAFSFRAAIARLLPNDDPFDGKVYAQIARNVLEQHVYSHASEPPYEPSLIRLPGYPLFLAGIYSFFGHYDNTAVRITQALLDTATCGLVALIAFYWEPDEKRKRSASIVALALAAVCPFTTIYVGIILAETPTIFLALAMTLTATLAFKAPSVKKSVLLWAATGIIAGLAVLFRPDAGLFAAAIGITLVVTTLFRPRVQKEDVAKERFVWGRFFNTFYFGAVFTMAFCIVLVPWTIRNERVFHLFQPLAPKHAEMPGEFVPRGYLAWLRTWLDDGRYIAPVLWSLDELPIKIDDFPDQAFDSAQEKAKVTELLDRYNHPPQEEAVSHESPQIESESSPTPEEDQDMERDSNSPQASPNDEEQDRADEENQDEESASEEGDSNDQPSNGPEQQDVGMTPEIDAGFAEIARARIGRAPLRYYLLIPAKRAVNLWFDTHSQYYPFEGELLPLEDLDYDIQQHVWLPLFAGLTWIYTFLGVAGGWFLWRSRQIEAHRWLLLATLMIFLRLAFFATVENPEPRYVVEIFPFLSILGGIGFHRVIDLIRNDEKGTSGFKSAHP